MRLFPGAYIEDILIYTKTLEDHLQALRKVYDKLRQESFFAGTDKGTLVQQESNTVGLSLASMASGLNHGNYWQFGTGLPHGASQT